jgi:hypothetical protein
VNTKSCNRTEIAGDISGGYFRANDVADFDKCEATTEWGDDAPRTAMHTVRRLKRRAFLGAMASTAVAAIVGVSAQPRRLLRLVVLGAADDAIRRSGELGVAEVRRMTELLGVRFTCDTVAATTPVPAALLSAADAIVVLSNASRSFPDGVAAPMIAATRLVAAAPPHLFSVRASAAAKTQALESVRSGRHKAVATEWHASLLRYGAEQLNARFLVAGITPLPTPGPHGSLSRLPPSACCELHQHTPAPTCR